MSVNITTFMGRLTDDFEDIEIGGGHKLVKSSIAVRGAGPKGEDGEFQAGFFKIQAWGKTGELLQSYTSKGQEVGLVCRTKQNKWKNAEGQNREETIFEVIDFHLVSNKGEGGNVVEGEKTTEKPKVKVPADSEYDPFADE